MLIFQSIALGGGGRRGPAGLLPAVALSLLLHLLVLWPAATSRVPDQAGVSLAATLRLPPAPATPAVAAAAVPGPPVSRAEAPPVRPRASVPPVLAAAAVSAAPAVATPAPVAVAAAPPVAAASAGGTDGAPDANGLSAYRIALARGARPHKRYPPLARERGWAGTVEVRIVVAADGRAPRVALGQSSGRELLDREALAMLARAAAEVPLPASLRGQAFAVSLPVVFDLAEAE